MNQLSDLALSNTEESVALLSVDECSVSNEATYGYTWGEEQGRITEFPNIKSERRTIFGAVEMGTGCFNSIAVENGNAENFLYFLGFLVEHYKKQGVKKLIIVLDNARIHHAKLLKPFLEENKDFLFLHFIPPYSPELNPIERVWWLMRKSITHNRYVKTINERLEQYFKWAIELEKPNKILTKLCA